MRTDRLILAAGFITGFLLILPGELSAQPGVVQHPAKVQRIAKNNAIQQRKKVVVVRKKKHYPEISGTVVSIHHNKQSPGSGTIKLAVANHQRKNNGQKAGNARAAGNQANVVNKPLRRAAIAVGAQKKKTHTVTVSFVRGTKFAVTARGLVQGKPQVKTVGSGKAKTKIVVPGNVKMATRNLATNPHAVQKGQHLKITMHDQQHHNAREVHIIHASAMANNGKK